MKRKVIISSIALTLTMLGGMFGLSSPKAFFFSKEFDAMNVSDGKFVDRLYQTFMDRKPSNEERDYWVKKLLYTLYTRREAIVFFGNSEEFANICATYGIDQGTM